MKTRRFGRTNRPISVFTLGTMRCLATAETAHQVLKAAVQQGINHVETAPAYGQSEAFIGQALATGIGRPRQELVITTKLLPCAGDQVERQVEQSLSRLGCDYVDCLAVHGINTPEQLALVCDSMMPGLDRLRADGRIHHVGFSTHGAQALILAAIATNHFDFINLHYTYFFQRHAPAIDLAHRSDLGIFIISPADKGGLLYTPPDQLKTLCQPYDPLLLTYRWLLSDPRITTLSVGPAIPDELTWPLQVADQVEPLNASEEATFNRLSQHQQAVLGSEQCRQCYDCLPCPEAINIPEILRLRNLAVAYDMTQYGEYRYRMFEQAGHWFPGNQGKRCTDCGDCLPRCPEKLEIPALLRDAHQRLQGPARRRLWS